MSYTSQRNQLPAYLVNKDKHKKWKKIGDFQVKELMDNRSPAPLVLFIFLVSSLDAMKSPIHILYIAIAIRKCDL